MRSALQFNLVKKGLLRTNQIDNFVKVNSFDVLKTLTSYRSLSHRVILSVSYAKVSIVN